MKALWPPIPEGDPPDRRADKSTPWHLGLMITQQRAIYVASALFPEEIADGSDCRAQWDRIGEPCDVCADRNAAWGVRVQQVRKAMLEAFGFVPSVPVTQIERAAAETEQNVEQDQKQNHSRDDLHDSVERFRQSGEPERPKENAEQKENH